MSQSTVAEVGGRRRRRRKEEEEGGGGRRRRKEEEERHFCDRKRMKSVQTNGKLAHAMHGSFEINKLSSNPAFWQQQIVLVNKTVCLDFH